MELGYEDVFFVDDCFTLNSKRVMQICDEIRRRGLKFGWECLARVDAVSTELAQRMREAGCRRIFFGIESGNDGILKEMGKQFTLDEARRAVECVSSTGIDVGAFFIVGYPGETEATILDTLKYATSLPLEYLSFTLPYPIPGTTLYEKVKDAMEMRDWERPSHSLIDHSLIYRSKYSEAKLKFAIAKGMLQFEMKRRLGRYSPIIEKPFEKATDYIFRKMK